MKKYKCLLAILMLISLVSLLCVSASAEETEAHYSWELSADQAVMTYGEAEYTYYPIPRNIWFRPYTIHHYFQSIYLEGHSSASYIGHPYNEGALL